MRISLAGVFVDDQAKALEFYTNTLGFEVKHNIALGEHSWTTVTSPGDPDGTELLLEPSGLRPLAERGASADRLSSVCRRVSGVDQAPNPTNCREDPGHGEDRNS